MMGLAEMETCGTLAIAIEAADEATRRRNVRLSARSKAISAEDKAIGAARPTIDLRNPNAIAAFNKRVLAHSQAVAAYNREVDADRSTLKAGKARSGEYTVLCSQRHYDPALLTQMSPAASKAISAVSSTTRVPMIIEPAPAPAQGVAGSVVIAAPTSGAGAGSMVVLAPPPTKKMRVADLQAAAAAGDAEAQYLIGLAYLDGRDVGRNPEQAVGWLEKAAERNHAKALFALSVAYSDGTVPEDEKRSFGYLKRAAEAGLPDAQHNLGIFYARDRDGRPDLPNAIAWLTKAATAGDPESQYILAAILERGPGGQKDAAESLAWMRRSADQGFRDAQRSLGDRYRRGKGVPEDKVEALKWYLLAGGATKVDATRSCLRLMTVSREVRENSRAAADSLRQSMAADAIAVATRRADDWVVSFTATKVAGC